ncbi:MAG TPA: hypothetical protein VGK20_04740 [Candidatus Binatia bacterium]
MNLRLPPLRDRACSLLLCTAALTIATGTVAMADDDPASIAAAVPLSVRDVLTTRVPSCSSTATTSIEFRVLNVGADEASNQILLQEVVLSRDAGAKPAVTTRPLLATPRLFQTFSDLHLAPSTPGCEIAILTGRYAQRESWGYSRWSFEGTLREGLHLDLKQDRLQCLDSTQRPIICP